MAQLSMRRNLGQLHRIQTKNSKKILQIPVQRRKTVTRLSRGIGVFTFFWLFHKMLSWLL